MYRKQVLLEKLKEAAASVLPISLIVLTICFVLVPVDTGLMLSFVLATAMLILGMGLFTLGAEMSMSKIGNYMGAKLTKSRRLGLILIVSFLLGVAITVAEPDLQVLAANVPEIDKTVLILTVSDGVGIFLMLCMVRILFGISLRLLLIVFYVLVFLAAFLSDQGILAVAFDSGGVTTGPMTVPFIMALGVGVASIRSDENAKADIVRPCRRCAPSGRSRRCCCWARSIKTAARTAAESETASPRIDQYRCSWAGHYLHAFPEYHGGGHRWRCCRSWRSSSIFQIVSLRLRQLPFLRVLVGILYTYVRTRAVPNGRERWLLAARLCRSARQLTVGWQRVAAGAGGHADGLVHHQRRARRPYPQPAGGGAQCGHHHGARHGREPVRRRRCGEAVLRWCGC